MLLQVVVVKWKEDADPDLIKEFLAFAPTAMERGPFRSYTEGATVGVMASSWDWGFVAELERPEDVDVWINCDAHVELNEKIKPIRGEVCNIQLPR
ncbi:MAG TPA: hypothetical protein VHB02_14780 [Acidimicrobiales bacterium]|nr:hypothetical protein [Acidimicrobiales bacterium]